MDTWRSKDPLPLFLVLLTFTTGLVDAVSYLGLGRVFTANMTLGVPDLTATVLTLTLTGLAADSWFAGGNNPRPIRRVGAVAAMLGGAVLGGMLVLHSGLVWPLVLTSSITVAITVLYALHPAARRVPAPPPSAG